MTDTPPLPPLPPDAVGLLLAAGGGRRLGGRPKALLPHHGRPLVEHAVRVLREGGCRSEVHVVLGAAAEAVRRDADLSGCTVRENPDWTEGMGTSLRVGLTGLAGSGARGAVILLVDQPGIGPRAVARVLTALHSPATLAAAGYGGRRGHPVLLGADHWRGAAEAARGDVGARDYLRSNADRLELVECGDVADPGDVDTPGDLDRLTP